MAYDINKDPNIVRNLGGGKWKNKAGKVVDKYGVVIKQGETLASTPKPKFNLFDFQTKVPGTNVNKVIPSTTAIATKVEPKRNIFTPSSPASMVKPVTPATPTTGIPGIPTASANEKDLIQTYFDDKTQDIENKKTFVQMLKDGVPSTEIEDILVNKIKYKPIQPKEENVAEKGLVSSLQGRVQDIKGADKLSSLQVGPISEKQLQQFGALGGAFGDIVSYGIGKAIPDDWKESLANSGVGKGVIQRAELGGDLWDLVKKASPRGAKAVENFVNAQNLVIGGPSATAVAKQAPKVIKQTGKVAGAIVSPISSPIKTIAQQGKTLLGTPDEIQGIQQAIKPYVKISQGKVIRSNEQITNEIKRANELIKQAGDKPTDLATYRQSVEKQLKNLGNQISERTGRPLEIDLTDTASKIREIANKPTVGLLDKSEGGRLLQIADDLEKNGKISVSDAEYMNQWINDTIKNQATASETYKRGLNILVKDIREKLDTTLSEVPGEFKQIKKDYGALRNILGDTVKREIVYNRRNPEGLITSIGKMEGFGDVTGGLLKIIGLDIKGGVSDIGKGLVKNKVGTFIKTKNDPNYIINQIFNKSTKNGNTITPNIPSITKNNIGTAKASKITPPTSDKGKTILKPKVETKSSIPDYKKPENSKKAFIAPGKILSDVKKVVSPSDNLIKEARKYKSADEFIKAQGDIVYHGSNSIGKHGVPGGVIKEWKVGIPTMRSDKSAGIYFGNKVVGERYARDGKGILYEARLGIKNPKEFPATVEGYMKFGTLDQEDVKQMIKEGYDGAHINASWKDDKGGSNDEWFAIYPERIKTDAELKQIYEQANKKLLK